jgi:hypothetical protein
MRCEYLAAAAKIKDGLVVASWTTLISRVLSVTQVLEAPVACRRRLLIRSRMLSVTAIVARGVVLTLKVTRVGHDDGAGLLEVVEGSGHGGRCK